MGASHLLQDVASALGPDERLGFGIVMGDVFVDGGYQPSGVGK